MFEEDVLKIIELFRRFKSLDFFRDSSPISVRDFVVLSFIQKSREKVRPSLIAEHFGLTLPATSDMLRRLLSKKFIEKVEDTKDRRAYFVILTHYGKEQLEEACKERMAHFEHIADRYGKENLEQLYTYLNQLYEVMSKEEIDIKEGGITY